MNNFGDGISGGVPAVERTSPVRTPALQRRLHHEPTILYTQQTIASAGEMLIVSDND
jgi:hypothetical protein